MSAIYIEGKLADKSSKESLETPSGLSFGTHLLLIYKDDLGREYVIRGGPSGFEGDVGGLGKLEIQKDIELQFSYDQYIVVNGVTIDTPESRGRIQIDLDGRSAEAVWDVLDQHAKNIHDHRYDYIPNGNYLSGSIGYNSNGVIGNLLSLIGIDVGNYLPAISGLGLGGYASYDTKFIFDHTITGTSSDDMVFSDDTKTHFALNNSGYAGGYDTVSFDKLNHSIYIDLKTGIVSNGDSISGVDELVGTRFNDTFDSSAMPQQAETNGITIHGGAGNDHIEITGTDMIAYGDSDDDTITMMSRGAAFGGSGDDTLSSSTVGGYLSGESGNDLLIGNIGDDTILGGADDDLIAGSAGNDFVDGGDGFDILSFAQSAEAMQISGSHASTDMSNPIDWSTGISTDFRNFEKINGSLNGDTFRLTPSEVKGYEGLAGEDTFVLDVMGSYSIDGGSDMDTLDLRDITKNGEFINFTYYVKSSEIQVIDFAATKTANIMLTSVENILWGNGYLTIAGTGDADTINFTGRADMFSGEDGNDILNVILTNDTSAGSEGYVWGGYGNDVMHVQGASTIDGASGKDEIWGSIKGEHISGGYARYGIGTDGSTILTESDDDDIHAGGGDDVIMNLSGNDKVDGGSGIDVFETYSKIQGLNFSLSNGKLVVSTKDQSVEGANAILENVEYVALYDESYNAHYINTAVLISRLQAQSSPIDGSSLENEIGDKAFMPTYNLAPPPHGGYGNAPSGNANIVGNDLNQVLDYRNGGSVSMTIDSFLDKDKVAVITNVNIGYQNYTGIQNVYNVSKIITSGNPMLKTIHVGGVSSPLTEIESGVPGYNSIPLSFDISKKGVTINLADGVASTTDWSLKITGFEYVTGSKGDDTFILNSPADAYIIGGGGIDTADYSRSQIGINLTPYHERDQSSHVGPRDISNFIGSDFDDTFRFVDGHHRFDGGDLFDTVDYQDATSPIEFDGKTGKSGVAGTDTLVNVERVIGTSNGGDVFRGGDGMIFVGGGGRDTFHTGRGGSHYSSGGGSSYQSGQDPVDDTMIADAKTVIHLRTPDLLNGETRITDDIGTVATGIEKLILSSDDDVVYLGDGIGDLPRYIEGGGGSDTIHVLGSGSLDVSNGSYRSPNSTYEATNVSGFSIFYIEDGSITGSSGIDEIHGGNGTRTIDGGAAGDRIFANGGSTGGTHAVYGGIGDDRIWSAGFDTIDGGDGDDILYSGLNTRYVEGGAGNDIIHAEAFHAGPMHVTDQTGINRIFASQNVEIDFNVGSYDHLIRVHDVGGAFQVDMMKDDILSSSTISGVDHVNFYGTGIGPMALVPGMDFFGL